jgi:hypothetical protein
MKKNLYLLVIIIVNQLNILKIKLTKIILEKNITKQKKAMWKKNIVAILSNVREKL